MLRKRTIIGTLITTAVFIALEIAAVSLMTHNGNLQNFFIHKAAHKFMGKVWGVSEDVSYYFSLRKENEKLAEQVHMLMEKLNRQNSILLDIEAESRMLHANNTDSLVFIHAEIIKNSTNKQHNYLIINKGSEDGISPQSGVVTPEGVVGIVDAVSENYSYVRSFLNTKSSISTRIGIDGDIGAMEWSGKESHHSILKSIPLQSQFEVGDTVFTSGYSAVFPPGIPLGTITGSQMINGSTYDIDVRLFQNFNSVRFVTVVSNRNIAEIANLEESVNGHNEKEGSK